MMTKRLVRSSSGSRGVVAGPEFNHSAWRCDLSIEPIRGLKERTPALCAELRKPSLRGSRAITARACHFTLSFGPHGPITPADADAEILGKEVGQHAFDLYTPASVPALIKECGRRARNVIVTSIEIGSRQVSDVATETPTLGEHGFGA